jgi:pterin-4a-carbinolamine dehydratase
LLLSNSGRYSARGGNTRQVRPLAPAYAPRARSLSAEKPVFYVILSERDEWAVEAEWLDGTLERVNTFRNYSAAMDWVATQSEAWLHARQIERISMELKAIAITLDAHKQIGRAKADAGASNSA